jgi:hypothetical protein
MERKKIRKINLPMRVEPGLIPRLNRVSAKTNSSVSSTISAALDALEKERSEAVTVGEKLEFLEKNLLALVELMEIFDRKIDRHFVESGACEKERLGAMYRLLEARLTEHDAAEKERFKYLTPHIS